MHGMSHTGQLAGPVVGGATGFNPDKTGRELREKGGHAVPAQGFTQDNVFMVIHGMYLEDIFSQVETNTFNIHDGHLLRGSGVNTSVWHFDAVRWEVSITSGYATASRRPVQA